MERKKRTRAQGRILVCALLAAGLLGGCQREGSIGQGGAATSEAVAATPSSVRAQDLSGQRPPEQGPVHATSSLPGALASGGVHQTKKPPQPVKPAPKPKEKKNYAEIFRKDVFFGDSLTDSLSYYGFLDQENVIAKLGLNLTSAKKKIPAVIQARPEHLYLLFGSNDVEIGAGADKFAKKYKEMVKGMEQDLPDTVIHIQAILPVMAKKDKPDQKLNNRNIDLYNQALKQMCQEEGWSYVDINTLAKENPDQFEPDAIHVKASFYPLWLDLMEKVREGTPE